MTERRYGKRDEARESEPLEVTLTSNPTLLHLIDTLKNTTEVQWDKLAQQAERGNNYESYHLLGIFMELHVQDILERTIPGILTSPLTGNKGRFTVERIVRGGFTASDSSGTNAAEYDALTVVEDLPVVWEVKSGLSDRNSRGLKSAFKNETINRKLNPLRDYYQTDRFGFVVVTFPSFIESTPGQRKGFLRNGGIHAKLHGVADTFHMGALRTKIKYKL
jgi:hypothetical protein